MLRSLESIFDRRALFAAICSLAIGNQFSEASDEIPSGYNAERYQKIWERNPFTLVTPAVKSTQPQIFDKLILVSWLNNAGQDVVFIENTETNEVQKVTSAPNSDHLRLVSIHKDADPKKSEVVLSDGIRNGSVKFRMEVPQVAQNQNVQALPGQYPGARPGLQPGFPQQQNQKGKNPGAPIFSRTPAQMPAQAQVPMPPTGQAPVAAQGDATMTMQPPRASEVRRKRITAPPVTEQPVDGDAQSQTISPQPQSQ
jgi:hypothetical protein